MVLPTGPGWHSRSTDGHYMSFLIHMMSHSGQWLRKHEKSKQGWLARADGWWAKVHFQDVSSRQAAQEASATTAGHSFSGLCPSRTWTQHAGSHGPLRVTVMSQWTEPRVSSESRRSTSWPLSSLPVSLKSQDLWAMTQGPGIHPSCLWNPLMDKDSLLAPNDMS